MLSFIRNPKDFGAGLLYAVLGGAAVFMARNINSAQPDAWDLVIFRR